MGLAAVGLIGSLPFTERGSAWLLQGAQALVPALNVQGPHGPLLGDFGAERITWQLNARQRLVIEGARWQSPRLTHDPAWGLHLRGLQAERVALEGQAPADATPTVLPTDLSLPVGLFIDQVSLTRIDLPALGDAPLRTVHGELRLPAGARARHELRGLSLQWERLQAQGSLGIDAHAPLLLKAQLALRNDAPSAPGTQAPAVLAEDWQAQLQAQGTLASIQVQGRLRARGQSLDAEALVRPDHPMPIERAQARMAGFDLAGLSRRLPRTALAGLVAAELDNTAANTAPLALQLKADLSNTAADRWDANALPARALQLQARTTLDHPEQGTLQQLLLDLGTTRRSAGRLQAQGLWRTDGSGAQRAVTVQLQTRLQDLQPAELDQRAPSLELSGPARVDWRQPWPAAGTAADPATGLGTGHLQADWTGHHLRPTPAGTRPDVRLQLDARGTPEQLTLHRFEATAGPSQWRAEGQARREANAWALQLQSTLRAFDPALWLGPIGNLPPSRIDATIDGQLRWLDAATANKTTPSATWQQRLRGQANLQLQPSVLAGVPGQGHLQLRSQPGLQAQGLLQLGHAASANANAEPPVSLSLQGRLDDQAARDHWDLRWTARQLDALNPWLRTLAGRPELSGQSQGQLSLDGRWPHLASGGQAQAALLRWRQTAQASAPTATASIAADATRAAEQVLAAAQRAAGDTSAAATPPAPASAKATTPHRPASGIALHDLHDLQAQWQFGSQPGDAFQFDARLAQAHVPGGHLLATTVRGEGSMQQHTLRAQSTVVPQPAGNGNGNGSNGTGPGAPSAAVPGSAPWSLQLAAAGGWQLGQASPGTVVAGQRPPAGSAAAAWGWQGQLQQLQASRTTPPTAAVTASPARPAGLVLRLDPASLSLLQDDQGTRIDLGATRLLFNDAVLAIETLHWDRTTAGTSLDLRSQLQPTHVPALLALAQPGFGWRGDLQVSGRLDVRARPASFQALLALGRLSGDLAVEDTDLGTGPQALGLSELQLKLQAQDGRWTFSERVAGARMGRLQGDFSATTDAARWVPEARAPLRGQLDLDVSQLGYWGAWLPTGWRLAGQLSAHAQVSGTVGDPQLTGEVQGQRIAVRNVLQGVDWRDAELRARLTGDALLLDSLTLKAGTGTSTGTLSATGKATLGTSPTVAVQARAERFAALQRVDRRVVASGDAELLIDATRLRLTGALKADEGRIDFTRSDAPGLSDDVEVLRPSQGESQIQSQRKGTQRALQLDLRADLGPQFQLVGRGLNTRLTGELRLTSPNSKPQLTGAIRAEDGTYAAYGQKLQIDRGLITFTGPIENPRLDVQAIRADLDDVRVGVAITGTAQSPRVRLFSDPEMTDTDKLSWLLMGRASDGLGRTDLALLQRAAYALLSGESDSPSLIQRLGIDSLSVSQSDGTVQETVVSLGKQLSRRWYLGYERSLQATTGTWLLTYRLAQRFTVRGQSGAENALDVIWSWKWGLNE